jgi:hypothetical protein
MPINLGAIERPKDERDFLLGAIQAPITIPAQYIPDISWLTQNWQSQIPACGSHAGSHFQAILEHQLTPTVNQRYTPRYLWIRIKQIDGFPLESGTDMRSIFKTLQNNGADDFEPLENDVSLPLATYSDPSVITPAMDADAANQKITSYAFGNTDFESLCQHIYQNKAVLLLIKCDDAWWQSATPTFTNPLYGHFICAYGYDPNSIYIIDSADRVNPLKQINKQYIVSPFIVESGTAIDISPEQVQKILQTTQAVQTLVTAAPIPTAQKIDLLAQIVALLKSLTSLLSPKVGTSAPPMNTKPWYASKTIWFNGLTVIVAAATIFGWTLNQDLFNQITAGLLAIAPLVNIVLRLYTNKAIALPANPTQTTT